MKWLKIIFALAEIFIPGLAKFGKVNLVQELDVARKTIKVLARDMTPEETGRAIESAIGGLKAVQSFKKRAVKKLDQAKLRLYKKLF